MLRHVAIRTSILDRFPCRSRTNITRTHSLSNSFLIYFFFPYFQVPSPPGHSFSFRYPFACCVCSPCRSEWPYLLDLLMYPPKRNKIFILLSQPRLGFLADRFGSNPLYSRASFRLSDPTAGNSVSQHVGYKILTTNRSV
jgi:hypothetical protein